jgi:hypothetical protein
MGYISARAAIGLWVLGLAITSIAIYFIYSGAIQYISTVLEAQLVTALLVVAGFAILAYWAFVLSRAVVSDEAKPSKS